MKPQHLDEAQKIIKQIRILDDKINDLKICTHLSISLYAKETKVESDNPAFGTLKAAMITVHQHDIAALIRRANQISLSIPNRDMIQKG